MAKKAKTKQDALKPKPRRKKKSKPKRRESPDAADDAIADAALLEHKEEAARDAAMIADGRARIMAMIEEDSRDAVRAELAPLHDALNLVRVRCSALALSIRSPWRSGSGSAGRRWKAQWRTEYVEWLDAIRAARKLAVSPAVVAIMDAGEQRPTEKWTSRTVAHLDRLKAVLHPTREGLDGLGFIREGAESLPANFAPLAQAIATRVAELQSVPQFESAAPVREDGEWKPAAHFPVKIHGRLRQATRNDRKSKRVRKKVVDGTILYSLSDARRWWGAELE